MVGDIHFDNVLVEVYEPRLLHFKFEMGHWYVFLLTSAGTYRAQDRRVYVGSVSKLNFAL